MTQTTPSRAPSAVDAVADQYVTTFCRLNPLAATAIGVAQVSHSMARMIEFRSDVILIIFFLVAVTFVVITLPMGMLTSWLSQRLAVRR